MGSVSDSKMSLLSRRWNQETEIREDGGWTRSVLLLHYIKIL